MTQQGRRQRKICYCCGATDHIARNCPKNSNNSSNDNSSKSDTKDETDWRHKPPNKSKGESAEKEVDGKKYKWCGKCRGNKGLWTTGKYLHSTAEHRPKKKDTDKDESKEEGTGNLACIDEPLEFGFMAYLPSAVNTERCTEINNAQSKHPKGRGGNH